MVMVSYHCISASSSSHGMAPSSSNDGVKGNHDPNDNAHDNETAQAAVATLNGYTLELQVLTLLHLMNYLLKREASNLSCQGYVFKYTG